MDWLLYNILISAIHQHELAISQCSSVAQSCPTLCDPMNCSTPGLPVHHQLPEFTQTHVHRVSDAMQPSHPLSFPSPPAPNPSQHHSLFQWVGSLYQVAKFWSFTFSISPSNEYSGWYPLGLIALLSLQSKGLFRSSPAPQFKSINSSALSLLYGPTLTSIHDHWKNHSSDYTLCLCQQTDDSAF